MRAKLLILGLACLLFVTGCEENSPTAPTVPLNQDFTLAPGQAAVVQDTSIRIEFVRVFGDSRCPADVVCIQGGDALVQIRVMDNRTTEYDLHTGDDSRAAILHQGLRIVLVNLQPYPFSTRTIGDGEYRASLRVSRN